MTSWPWEQAERAREFSAELSRQRGEHERNIELMREAFQDLVDLGPFDAPSQTAEEEERSHGEARREEKLARLRYAVEHGAGDYAVEPDTDVAGLADRMAEHTRSEQWRAADRARADHA
ncbi:hypothetical protein [Haloactinomyces albus]|uniref:Uncharacterized protein n=1 Tax=Haloactinomyces albus TaxID=1352928 RepID=A0AAE3ZFU7_9ACTN|nr:hypothetical protein [Haloactinomyces albus]MDR7302779.1 hypothetical protein [Haloactinomyces albus]